MEGLAFIHNKMIIHRDIKTDNIVLRNDEVKIVDFGLCKLLASPCTEFSADVRDFSDKGTYT